MTTIVHDRPTTRVEPALAADRLGILSVLGYVRILGLFALTSVAVFWFYRRESHAQNIWVGAVAPVLSAAGLGWLFAQVRLNDPLLPGEQTPSLASRLLSASSIVLLLAGLARAGWLYAYHRDTYRRIGGSER